MIIRSLIFCEEACSCPNATFETPADDSDDDANDKAPTPLPPTDNNPHDAPPPSEPPHIPSSTSQARPTRPRHAPPRFDPDSFGAHGRRKEAIANAYEDLINDALFANAIAPDLVRLALSDAHLTDSLGQIDASLPDAPSLREALSGPERDKWHSAILEELAAIKDAGTWELIDYSPSIRNVIGCQFVLQKKRGPDGEVTKYKARLVTQGFSQQEGIDYLETFAPVVKSASLRIFLAICAQHGWKI